MKKMLKKSAVVALAGVMSVGMLSGCGDKKEAAFDGTKTVATVNGEEIPAGVLSYFVRNQQAYLVSMYEAYGLGQYVSNMWDGPVSEDSEETYGEMTRGEVLEQVETMYLIRSKAAEYGVELTAEEQEKMAAAAAAFMEANSEETIATLGVTEEDIRTYLELETYFVKMHDPIIADTDREVSDEQAQMSSFKYVHVSVKEEEAEDEADLEDAELEVEAVEDEMEPVEEETEEAEAVETEEAEEAETEEAEEAEEAESEEAEAEEAEEVESEEAEAEETEAEPAEETEAQKEAREKAEAIYEALKADEKGDMNEIVKAVDDSLYALNGTFQTNLSDDWDDDTSSYYNEDMLAAVRELKEGELTDIISTDDGYYIARLEKENDEDATERERESIISDRENEHYTEVTEGWRETADITVNEEVLATLKVTDSQKFTLVSTSAEEEEDLDAEEIDLDAEESEEIDLEEAELEVVDETEELTEVVEEEAEEAAEEATDVEAAEEAVDEEAAEETTEETAEDAE